MLLLLLSIEEEGVAVTVTTLQPLLFCGFFFFCGFFNCSHQNQTFNLETMQVFKPCQRVASAEHRAGPSAFAHGPNRHIHGLQFRCHRHSASRAPPSITIFRFLVEPTHKACPSSGNYSPSFCSLPSDEVSGVDP